MKRFNPAQSIQGVDVGQQPTGLPARERPILASPIHAAGVIPTCARKRRLSVRQLIAARHAITGNERSLRRTRHCISSRRGRRDE
jgi:hypothetical protein